MTILGRVTGMLRRGRDARRVGEDDAPVDLTHNSENDDAVGRESGDESGVGESGAERRAGGSAEDRHEGALRDD